MPSFPVSVRLLALPVWALLVARERLAVRRGLLLEARVGGREPLPSAEAFTEVARAPGVTGVHLVVEGISGGWASLRAARQALAAVRAAGRRVTMELEHCGNAELYLASVADRVWIRPMVEVQAMGVAASMRFAGGALARFGLRFDVEAAGAYKAAGETFTRAWASPENREATRALVDGLQDELVGAVAAGRRLEVSAVRAALADGPLAAEEAVRRGLVDALAYPDEVRAEREAAPGARRFPLRSWLRRRAALRGLERWMQGGPVVGVVHLEGPVVDGEGPPGAEVIAAEPSCRVLDALAEDDRVRAVVLAVQSPGGSAVASDRIWRSVERLAARKVVVAAFRDVAASGGYYLAAPAREIFVQPNTITGSIGVVGGKLVLRDALAEVGVYGEQVLGAPDAAMYGADAPFTPGQRVKFRASLERFYRGFVERVAAGRGRPYDRVEPLARGRVWTGVAAVDNGLADRFGGVGEAVARASELAGDPTLARYDIRVAPRSSRLARLVRGWFGAAVPPGLAAGLVPSALTTFLLAGVRGPLALWPYEVDVRG